MGADALAWLRLAERTAEQAARMLRAERDGMRRIRQRLDRDLKLDGDQALDRFIAARLEGGSPFPMMSEERAGAALRAGTRHWIVDPLDGSVNFARGIPLSCISIALWRGRAPLLGVIYDVHRMERFSGIVGQGAWLDGRPIRVGAAGAPRDAVLCTGFPVGRDFSTESLASFVRHIQRYQKVRLLGSAALSLAYVACGRADAYEEERIALWDVAAGIAIVRAAGGAARCQPARFDATVTVAAGNRTLLQDS